MKQVFYKGLLALTIAFGVTSCDKNEMEGVDGPLTSVTKGITSKVSFGESVGITVKGKGDVAGKNASEFTHVYSSERQTIAIIEAGENGEIVFMGSYVAGDIGSGLTADEGYAVPIILGNGNYRAETMNNGGAGISYLPYSSAVDFELNSRTGTIELIATLEAGFMIVNVEDATEGSRVTAATYSIGDANSSLAGPDADGDYFAYLPGATYGVDVTYDLNGSPVTQSGEQRIVNGLAYTINLDLTADTPAVVGSIVSTSTLAGLESDLPSTRIDGGDINDDGDLFDTLERIVTSTQATLNEVPQGDPAISNGPWSIILDIDVDVDSSTVTSTERAESVSVNDDSDDFDLIQRVVTVTTTSTTGLDDASSTVNSEWTLLENRSTFGIGESGTDTSDGDSDPVDGFSDWSAWSPESADASEAMVVQTRTRIIVQNGDLDAEAPVGDLSQTQTVDNPLYVIPNGVDTWDVTGTYGGEEVLGALTYNDAPVDTSVQFYTRIGTQAYSITAAGNVETYNVVDAQDGDILDGATRNVETAVAQPGLSREASSVADTLNPNYVAPSTDVTLSVSDFTDNGDLTFTGTGAAAGHDFVIGVALDNISYDYTYDGVTSDIFTPADGSVAADDAAYAAAIDAAIATIEAAING